MNRYDYTRDASSFNLCLRGEGKKWRHYAVDFPVTFTTQHGKYQTVRGEYFQPRGTKRAPLVVLLHGVGDVSVLPCKYLARSLSRQGIACFILYLFVHSSRMPDVVRKRLPALSDDEWYEGYRMSVVEVRQVVDWAGSRAEVDEERIGVVGISFGGFISAIAMGVDERIGAGVFLVSAGNSSKIAQKARASAIRRGYRVSEAEYNNIQNAYTEYLTEVAERGFDQVVPARRSYLNDPMTYACNLQQRPVLMINARWDEFVPREAVEDFWQACGRPDIVWFAATHATVWLWYPAIKRKIGGFLESVFGV